MRGSEKFCSPGSRQWILRFVVFSGIALLFSEAEEATEFVVNQRNAAAPDDNPGSREKPFKTISAAASKVKAGDKVIVHGGYYRETVIINLSDTAQAPIMIETASEETPVIKGLDIITGWERDDSFLPSGGAKRDQTNDWRLREAGEKLSSPVLGVFFRSDPRLEHRAGSRLFRFASSTSHSRQDENRLFFLAVHV
jgi:hypothetical protein